MCLQVTSYPCGAKEHSSYHPAGHKPCGVPGCKKVVYFLSSTDNCPNCLRATLQTYVSSTVDKAKALGLLPKDKPDNGCSSNRDDDGNPAKKMKDFKFGDQKTTTKASSEATDDEQISPTNSGHLSSSLENEPATPKLASDTPLAAQTPLPVSGNTPYNTPGNPNTPTPTTTDAPPDYRQPTTAAEFQAEVAKLPLQPSGAFSGAPFRQQAPTPVKAAAPTSAYKRPSVVEEALEEKAEKTESTTHTADTCVTRSTAGTDVSESMARGVVATATQGKGKGKKGAREVPPKSFYSLQQAS